jgi:predicted nucleic-acid-binding Zn-ribbon protein
MKDPERKHVNGKDLRCLFCGEDEFYEYEVKMNKSVLVFLDIEWMGKAGRAYICSNCGYKHEFFN